MEMKITARGPAAVVAAALAAAVLHTTPVWAQMPSPVVDGETIGTPALVKAACAEGSVVYYTGQSANDERKIVKPFMKAFPCINVSVVSEVSGRLYERIRTETQAGKIQGDVALLTDPQLTENLIKQGVIRKWTPPSAAKYPSNGKLPGWWYAAIGTSFYPIYNTQMIDAKDAPKSWKDLLAPKYKGKIVTAPISVGGTAWIVNAFFRDVLGDSYLRGFYAQQPKLLPSYTAAAVAVARGEFPVGIVASVNDFPIRTAQHGPIRPVYPPEGAPFIPFEMMLLAKSQHPHAAELFANWYLSKQGQSSVVNERGAYSWRTDVPPAAGAPPLTKIKIWYPGLDYVHKHHDALISEVNKLAHN